MPIHAISATWTPRGELSCCERCSRKGLQRPCQQDAWLDPARPRKLRRKLGHADLFMLCWWRQVPDLLHERTLLTEALKASQCRESEVLMRAEVLEERLRALERANKELEVRPLRLAASLRPHPL